MNVYPVLFAPFQEDLFLDDKSDRFQVDSGEPLFGTEPWGYGTWGRQGAWGKWNPHLELLSSIRQDRVSIDNHYVPKNECTIAYSLRYTGTPSQEYIGEVGDVDIVRWGLDGWSRFFVEFDLQSGYSMSFISSPIINEKQDTFVCFGWDESRLRISVRNDETEFSYYTFPLGETPVDWGTGRLKLYSQTIDQSVNMFTIFGKLLEVWQMEHLTEQRVSNKANLSKTFIKIGSVIKTVPMDVDTAYHEELAPVIITLEKDYSDIERDLV